MWSPVGALPEPARGPHTWSPHCSGPGSWPLTPQTCFREWPSGPRSCIALNSWHAWGLTPASLGTSSPAAAAGEPSPLPGAAQTQRCDGHCRAPWGRAVARTEVHPWWASAALSCSPCSILDSAGRTSFLKLGHLNPCLRFCFWENLTRQPAGTGCLGGILIRRVYWLGSRFGGLLTTPTKPS